MAARRKPPTQALLDRRGRIIGAKKLYEKVGSLVGKNFPPLSGGYTSEIQFVIANAMSQVMNPDGSGKATDPEKVQMSAGTPAAMNLTGTEYQQSLDKLTLIFDPAPEIPEGQKMFLGLVIWSCDGDYIRNVVLEMTAYAEANQIDFDEVEVGDGCFMTWFGYGLGTVKSSIQGQCRPTFVNG
jgi:hypothetical protein